MMNKGIVISALLISAFILIFSSCKHDPVGPGKPEEPEEPPIVIDCDPDSVYFKNEILPLLISSCGVIGCHDPGTASDGVVLTDYASIINTGDVRPGEPDNSELYEAITEDDPRKRMPPPPKPALTAGQIAKIRKWIQQGAKNNECESNNCDTTNVTFAGKVWPVIQNSCLGCHSGSQASAGILLSNHSQIAQVASTGRLLGSIRHDLGFAAMPQGGNKLNECQITQIKKWIENGSPNN